uniref:Putative ovule protein n=1 Tax=Solanum chacoense TaxID=4108 RepID=A0A0V0GQQ0_SOLCH
MVYSSITYLYMVLVHTFLIILMERYGLIRLQISFANLTCHCDARDKWQKSTIFCFILEKL